MELKTYLQDHKQTAFAKRLGVTQGAVYQWANGLSAVSPERAVQIEQATEGKVTRRDLRPHDWARIWPELAANEMQETA